MLTRAISWLVDFEGSTRALGLLRIGLTLAIWSRFAQDMALFSTLDAPQAVLSACFFGSTVLMLVGLCTRISVPMTALTLAIIYFIIGTGGFRPEWSAHHVYLLLAATTLLAFTPCGRSYSLDRWLEIRANERKGLPPPEERGHLWGQRLIVLQMSALYFWTAYDKTGWHFLSGDRLESILMWSHSGRPLEVLLLSPLFLTSLAAVVVAVEYFLSIGILMKRLLPKAVPVGVALHAGFYILIPVNTYSITMILMYLAVLDPDAVHRFIDRLHGHAPAPRHL